MINSLKYLFTLLLFTALTIPGFPQRDVLKAETELQSIMKNLDAIGLSVAVVKDSKLIYTQSFGLKDVESNTPLAVDNVFRIADLNTLKVLMMYYVCLLTAYTTTSSNNPYPIFLN